MTNSRVGTRRGFTLVEILIVVIILGILAAIVIPQFTNASQNARESSLQSTLQTLRSQIQLYKLQHGDSLPDLAAAGTGPIPQTTAWAALTAGGTWGTPAQTFGPYMQAVPVNPMNGNSTILDGTVAVNQATAPSASGACGFVYDYNAGTGSGLIYGTDNTGTVIAGTISGGIFTAY
ncbi:MAG: prepilin-type N-terminal cleavage/methylation domain-containing protein [Tepidisphaeraceae bacterium]|jgi:general secretion pathway protein G